MSSTKLRNVEAVTKLLHGEHRTQTRNTVSNYITIDSKLSLLRKQKGIGETWFEYRPDGAVERVVTKLGVNTYYQRSELVYADECNGSDLDNYKFKNCQKDVCTCIAPTRLDEKFRVMKGMCFECNVALETKLKIAGKFNEYATDILIKNAEAYFSDTDAQMEDLKTQLASGTGYVNSDGSVEKWESSTGTPDSIITQIQSEYEMIKNNTINAIKGKDESI